MRLFKCLSFLFIVVNASQAFSQSKRTFDQLEKEIEKSTYYDSANVFKLGSIAIAKAKEKNNLSEIGKIYQHYGNFNYFSGRQEMAINYYDTSIVYALEANDSTLLNSTNLRKLFIERTDNHSAIKRFDAYYLTSKRRGDTNNMITSLNGKGVVYDALNENTKSLESYLKAYDLSVKINDLFIQGMLLNNIGLIKFHNKQYEQALEDFKEATKISEKIDNVRLAFNLQNNLGLVYEQLGMLEKSIRYYKKILKMARNIGFPYSKAIAHINLAETYKLNKEPNLSILNADSALFIFQQLNETRNLAEPYIIKAKSYLIKGDMERAFSFADSAEIYANRAVNIEDLISIYQFKSNLFEQTKQYKKALQFQKLYYRLSDSLSDVKNQKQFSELQVIYETEQKEAETEKKEAELNEERAQTVMLKKDNRLQQTKFILIISFSIFFVLVAGVLFYLRYLRIKKNQQQIYSQQLIENIDTERSRISRDLHDDIGQHLSVAKSKINLHVKGQSDNIDDLEVSLGTIIQQVRELSHNLHPSFIEKIGFRRGLISLLNQIEESTKLITSYEITSAIDTISSEKQNELYRIIQESINNTIKHSNARSIKVSITVQNEQFSMTYKDNGKGFDATSNTGFGLKTMKERALKMKAKFILNTQPGKGLTILVKFKE